MTLSEIEKFMLKQFELKKPQYKNFPTDVNNYILDYSKKYKWEGLLEIKYIFKNIKLGFKELPKCELSGCNNHVKITDKGNLTKCCCTGHSVKNTNLKKYGVTCTQQIKEIKDKTNKTMVSRYGSIHALQNKELKSKAENTMVSRYGVCNISYHKEFRKKAEDTMFLRYGARNPMQIREFKDKSVETSLKNNGGIGFQTGKAVNTMKLKYNRINPSQVSEFFEKAQESSFKRKEYIWESGEISLVQGYEPIVLKELEEQGYKFEEVLTSPKDMPEIFYQFEEIEHRYYPDIFIPKDNIIIEVKSEYTLKANWDINQLKFEATKSLGFDFRLEVR